MTDARSRLRGAPGFPTVLREPRVGWRPLRAAGSWVSLLLGLSGCIPVHTGITFRGLKAESPPVSLFAYAELDTLMPVLRWKPILNHSTWWPWAASAVSPDTTYDVAIWEPGLDPERSVPGHFVYWGTPVYEREGLTDTVHRVEMQLKPNTVYFWSVRTRQGSTISLWSTYSGDGGVLLGVPVGTGGVAVGGPWGSARNSLFGFKTPP